MTEHIHNARRQLADLARLAHETEQRERFILKSALSRMQVVDQELAPLKAQAITDQSASKRYQELVEESAILSQIISRARLELGDDT